MCSDNSGAVAEAEDVINRLSELFDRDVFLISWYINYRAPNNLEKS